MNCLLLDTTENWEIELSLDETLTTEELIPELIAELCLPVTDPFGEPMRYGLYLEEQAMLLKPTESLQSVGAKERCNLLLVASLPFAN